MKKLSNILRKIGEFFSDDLYSWIENDLSEFSRIIGNKIYKLARKIYPNNFCHYCGTFLERCYNPPLKEPPQYLCCNCQRPINEEEYK